MSDLPWSAFLAVDAGPFKTLCALWRHVSGETLWAARAESKRPWVCPSADTLADLTGRCKRSVESDLGRLRDAGWIARAWGKIEGRRLYGWDLADPEGIDVALKLQSGTEETCGVAPQAPKKPAVSPRKVDTETGPPVGDPPVTSTRAPAPSHGRPLLWLLTEAGCGAAAAADAAAPRTEASCGGRPAAGFGADDLVRLLGAVRLPPPAQRIVGDRPTRRRARLLLEVPLEGMGEDEARAARRGRFDQVATTAMGFSQICETDPDQLRWWCGQMLELEGQRRDVGAVGVSRWEHIEHLVAMRRASVTVAFFEGVGGC